MESTISAVCTSLGPAEELENLATVKRCALGLNVPNKYKNTNVSHHYLLYIHSCYPINLPFAIRAALIIKLILFLSVL